jgi:hypothetical protein
MGYPYSVERFQRNVNAESVRNFFNPKGDKSSIWHNDIGYHCLYFEKMECKRDIGFFLFTDVYKRYDQICCRSIVLVDLHDTGAWVYKTLS